MRISDWSSDVCSSDLAPGRGLEPVERIARPGTGDERRIVVRWRNDRRGAGLAVALPQQIDAVRATCGVAVADAERLPGAMSHSAALRAFGVTFFGRTPEHRLRHRTRRDEWRYSPQLHFRY